MHELLTKNRDFIEQNRQKPLTQLALTLANQRHPDAAFILQQVEGWQRLREKVPAWTEVADLLYPPRLSLEQCSGAPAAAYKRRVVERLFAQELAVRRLLSMADVTGGMGVDFVALAPLFAKATYVEQRAELVSLARHNFPLLGVEHADCLQGDGIALFEQLSPLDLLFIDPARRDVAGRKTVLIEDCEPNVVELLPRWLQRARIVMLKLSTMLDLHQAIAQLGCVAEAHVFAHHGECKDLLLVCRQAHEAPTRFFCAHDDYEFSFTLDEERQAPCPIATHLEGYLFEPDPAMMKVGAFRSVAGRWGLEKLHPNTHLYIASSPRVDFPGRTFRIRQALGFSKQELRQLKALGQANLTVRNFPNSVAELRRRLSLREGGSTYLFACTALDERKLILVCEKP